MRTLYTTFIIGIILSFSQIEARDITQHQLDSLYAELKEAPYPNDSMMVLYNIFDASPRQQQKKLARSIYSIAKRTDNLEVQLDILRNLGNIYLGNDSAQSLIISEVEKLPAGPEQKETLMFLRLLKVTTNSLMATPDQRYKYMGEALNKYKNRNDNMTALNQIELLYTLCVYLDATAQGDLLEKYMKESEEKIDKLPFGLYAFQNMFYAHSALMYTRNQDYEKAVEADRKLLGIMDNLEKDYNKQGRVFKDFDRNRYICYRRMLYNYPALSIGEVEDIMRRIWYLVSCNAELRADFKGRPFAETFYYMAKKDYIKAKPMLVTLLESDLGGNEYLRPRLSEMLCSAAEATGDKELYIKALKNHVDILKQYAELKSQNRYRELQIIYEMDNLTRENERLEEETAKAELNHQKLLLVGVVVIGAILLLVTLLMFRMYRKARKLSKGLYKTNLALEKERNALRDSERQLIEARDKANSISKMKSDFLDNMTHEVLEPLNAISGYTQLIVDSLGPDLQKRLEKYVKIVEMNCELLNTVVTDAISLSSLSKDSLSIVRQRVSLNQICNDALSSIEYAPKPGVEVRFLKEGADDIIVDTDPTRVQQVLANLLHNGAKFTEIGNVTLDYELNDKANIISFTVTDTGSGIPAGKEDVIFERFEKVDSRSQGLGLGLSIARQIARLLGGDVVLDRNYHAGSRFIFTLPLK
ncbi:MAG: HAMP domain-containing histidine kinase [Paramuribaculum sp.]|nr:HAMP domain-containing histidine kinase [Paramuribaculum sp.]